ncbi:hypothetical protein MRX96_001275 [Rhipicephalus microplus]
MASSSPSTVMMETPLPGTGGCFPTAEKEGYVTYWTHPQQEREHGVGVLDQPSFVPAQNVLERTADRCSIAPALGYVAFIGVRHDPSLFFCHDAARNSSLCNSKGRPADQGRANQVTGRQREMWPCHPLPAGRKPAPLFRCPSVRHGSSQQRRQNRFSRLSLNGCSERVAEFGDPLTDQCVAVGDSRSCSCVSDESGVVQQTNRRPQPRG